MKENVGGADRLARAVAGPALVGVGFGLLDGRRGRLAGLLVMAAGAYLAETAITCLCPLNEALGVDTGRRIRIE